MALRPPEFEMFMTHMPVVEKTTHSMIPRQLRRILLASIAAIGLGGCETFSADGGIGPVQALVKADLGKDAIRIRSEGDAATAKTRVGKLLRAPLTAESAVQIALLNNRGLQAAYDEIGISEAQFVQASLPENPRISLSRLAGSGEVEVERRLVGNLVSLFLLQPRTELAAGKLKQTQLRAAEETLKLAADTRRAYYRAVGARQLVGYLQRASLTAQAASELLRELGQTGAVGKIEQAREQAFYAELVAQLAQARLRERTEREKLTRLMGAWGADAAFKLPASLPPISRAPRSMAQIETDALRRRIDLKIARMEVDNLAKVLGLTTTTRYLGLIEATVTSKSTRTRTIDANGNAGQDRLSQFALDLDVQIPIFDSGEARTREAEETYSQAVNRLLEKAVNIRSEAREAYAGWRGTYDIARHYLTEVLPLRKIVSDESLLRTNGMLSDVSTLIVDSRSQVLSGSAAIEAQRDFWLADADLKAALVGGGLAGLGDAPKSSGSAAN